MSFLSILPSIVALGAWYSTLGVAGDTAVLGHLSPIGPLFGPQMGRYVPDPQRGECAADLGLVAGAKKLRGTRA